MKNNNLIQQKSFDFAVDIMKLKTELAANKEFIVADQLLRSSASIGANIEEALAAHSRKDFANKMSSSLKEARESRYWLELLDASKTTKNISYQNYLTKIEEIIRILSKIVKTLKNETGNTF